MTEESEPHTQEEGAEVELADPEISVSSEEPSSSVEEPDEPDSDEPGEPVDDESIAEKASRELSALRAVLRKTRRQTRAPLFFEGLAWFVATLGAVMVSAQFIGLILGDTGPAVMRVMLLIGSGAALLGGLVALVGFFRGRPSLDDVARTLQRHVPEFRSDIVAALQFGEQLQEDIDPDSVGWSPSLAYAHLRRTARALLGKVDGEGSLTSYLPARSLTPALVAVGGCLALLLAPYPFAGERISAMWSEVIAPTRAQEEEPEHRPIVGDIDILYSFPPYADMQPRFEPFTTGHIETLVGTEVTLKTYPLVAASRYEIVVKSADGERAIAMKKARGRLEGTLLLTKSGSYMFRAILADGTVIEDGIKRAIALQPDQAPEVVITSHSGEVEVSPDEVLEFEFSVSDDHGIESVTRANAFGQEDPRMRQLDLPELSSVPRSVESEFKLDLRELNLQPKDIVTVWVEASDNNSLTGPGTGKSEPVVLRVASPEDRHMKVIADEMQVLEALLMVLADFLENPAGERSPNSRGIYQQTVPDPIAPDEAARRFEAIKRAHETEERVLTEMSAVLDRMREDPLMAPRDVSLFESLYDQLYDLSRDGAEVINRHASDSRTGVLLPRELQQVADWASKNEDALEKGLIRLDELLASQKMESVKRTADEIRDLKERLKELLERYRDTQDPELKKAILREIQRLRQRMSELMRRMQSQLKKLPQEHVNMEAIEAQRMESDAQKMGESLERIEDLLEKGDIDGALEALDDMTASLDQMTEEMGEQFANAEPEGLREMDKALSELMDKANDLESRQRELERKTNQEQEEVDERERKRIERMLEERTREIAEMAAAQRRKLEQIARRDLARHDREAVDQATERVETLEEMLDNKDIEQALEQARGSREDLRALEFSLDLSERYTDEKTRRGKDIRQTLEQMQQMTPDSRRIVSKLEEIMEQARAQQQQSQSPQMQQLAGEQKGVQEQAESLEQDVKEAAERFPMLEQQLSPPLNQAKGEMGKATEGLEKQRPQQALDHQRAALEQLRQLKQKMRDALQKQNNKNERNGRGRQNSEKVVIPEKDGRTREAFREDILEGMREDRLEEYKSEIERYYESLME